MSAAPAVSLWLVIFLITELIFIKMGVEAASREQSLVRAALDDASIFDREDDVGFDDRFEVVSDDDDGLARSQASERFEHQLFGRRVEPRGGLIEDQDRRVADDGAGDGDALALAAGKRHAALADHRIVTF